MGLPSKKMMLNTAWKLLGIQRHWLVHRDFENPACNICNRHGRCNCNQAVIQLTFSFGEWLDLHFSWLYHQFVACLVSVVYIVIIVG